MRPAIDRRMRKKSYKNFNLAIYCPVGNLNAIKDLEEFDRQFEKAFGTIKVGRVYLEDFRGYETCEKDHLMKIKEYFEKKGIDTAGGITTCAADNPEFGFASLCYSDESNQKMLTDAVRMNAEIFDEFIFDDFYFLNCRCPKCIEKKGDRTWKEFRLEQKKWVTEELVMKLAHEINPDCNVIVKFPQWFEDFNEAGYDLDIDTSLFDSIYTGTETRNPTYSQQHLPKYLSYFTMRYYGRDKIGKELPESISLGGWFDPYECNYNLTSYLEQAYLTLFAKTPEVTLFCLGSLMSDPSFRTFSIAMGDLLEEVDEYMGKLGNPVGAAAYRPSYGYGEKNLHSYLGQAGIPMEPCLQYPENAGSVFLAESAADDPEIVAKMKKSLLGGSDVIVTSGFVKKLGKAFEEFGHVEYTCKKAIVNSYLVSSDHGVNIGRKILGSKEILIPQMDYCTNDVWEIAGAYGNDNNFPVLLSWGYGNGVISVITIPDDMGDFYHYPREILTSIREVFQKEVNVTLDAPSGMQLFVYDNDTVIIRSDLPYQEKAELIVKDSKFTKLVDLVNPGREIAIENGCAKLHVMPGVNFIYALQ